MNAALPPSVRKGFAFPIELFSFLRLCLRNMEAQPQIFKNGHGKAKPFCTDGGRAALNMIIGIVAVDKNGAIGKGGKLPWHYSADMKFFKETTIGNAVVMGRKTWLTLKKPLPQRLNIILSRESEIEPQDSVVVLRDVESVLALARTLDHDLYVIGGEQVYRSFLPHIDRWSVTRVPLIVEAADAFVPQNYLDGFNEVGSKELEPNLTAHYYERTPAN